MDEVPIAFRRKEINIREADNGYIVQSYQPDKLHIAEDLTEVASYIQAFFSEEE